MDESENPYAPPRYEPPETKDSGSFDVATLLAMIVVAVAIFVFMAWPFG